MPGVRLSGVCAEPRNCVPATIAIPANVQAASRTCLGAFKRELLMCVIQAYVFALLTTLYLNDAINLH